MENLLQSDYLDIIYYNRNKAYGGYELRKNYHQRMKTAGLIITGLCAAFAMYAVINAGKPEAGDKPITTVVELSRISDLMITPPPPPVKPPEPAAPPAVKPTVANPVPVIAPDEKVTIPPPTIDDMAGKESGPVNADGSKNGTEIATTNKTGTGTATTGVVKPPEPPAPYTYVEEMPAFNGSIAAYLQSQLKYPAMALNNNIQGNVIVQFVVNEKGDISDAKIVRGIGGGCDEEALRVVRGMPRWKPGRQNGQAVKVYYTLPIRFVLQ